MSCICYECKIWSRLIQPLLDAEVKPDLMLCGHEHRLGRSNGKGAANEWMDELRALPFPVVISACRTALDCHVANDALILRILAQMPDKSFQLQDEFTLGTSR